MLCNFLTIESTILNSVGHINLDIEWTLKQEASTMIDIHAT